MNVCMHNSEAELVYCHSRDLVKDRRGLILRLDTQVDKSKHKYVHMINKWTSFNAFLFAMIEYYLHMQYHEMSFFKW